MKFKKTENNKKIDPLDELIQRTRANRKTTLIDLKDFFGIFFKTINRFRFRRFIVLAVMVALLPILTKAFSEPCCGIYNIFWLFVFIFFLYTIPLLILKLYFKNENK